MKEFENYLNSLNCNVKDDIAVLKSLNIKGFTLDKVNYLLEEQVNSSLINEWFEEYLMLKLEKILDFREFCKRKKQVKKLRMRINFLRVLAFKESKLATTRTIETLGRVSTIEKAAFNMYLKQFSIKNYHKKSH